MFCGCHIAPPELGLLQKQGVLLRRWHYVVCMHPVVDSRCICGSEHDQRPFGCGSWLLCSNYWVRPGEARKLVASGLVVGNCWLG